MAEKVKKFTGEEPKLVDVSTDHDPGTYEIGCQSVEKLDFDRLLRQLRSLCQCLFPWPFCFLSTISIQWTEFAGVESVNKRARRRCDGP